MDIREKMRQEWDRRARTDARYWVAVTAEADEESYEATAVRDTGALLSGLRQRVPTARRVLDLGCGIGRIASRLTDQFAEVVGVDVSPEMVAKASELHSSFSNLSFQTNNGVDLGQFEDASFDLVFSFSVLPHLPPPVLRSYFSEVNRVLRPEGLFRYQFWIGTEQGCAANDTLSIRVYDQQTFASLHRDAGFRVMDVEPIDYVDPVMQLSPVWVNAQRVTASSPCSGRPIEVGDELSEAERSLEYGLLVYLAITASERGDNEATERVIEEALALDPKRVEAYLALGGHCQRCGDLEGAQRLFSTLTAESPDEPLGWLYLAQFGLGLAQTDAARSALERFDQLGCDDPEFLDYAAMLRADLPQAG